MNWRKFIQNKRKPRGSYAQMGEDLVVDFLLKLDDWSTMYYVDIGANDPVKFSNTYKFYRLGAKGVCVDPNPAFAQLYKKYRPRDKFVNAGIGIDDRKEADFYEMNWHVFSTFDKEQAEVIQEKYAGKNDIVNVVKLPLINTGELLDTIGNQEIDFLSLDVEGLDLQILQEWDFARKSPRVICVEIYDPKTMSKNEEIDSLLRNKGYVLASSNPINGVYILPR